MHELRQVTEPHRKTNNSEVLIALICCNERRSSPFQESFPNLTLDIQESKSENN